MGYIMAHLDALHQLQEELGYCVKITAMISRTGIDKLDNNGVVNRIALTAQIGTLLAAIEEVQSLYNLSSHDIKLSKNLKLTANKVWDNIYE